jgi:hypothetical protein
MYNDTNRERERRLPLLCAAFMALVLLGCAARTEAAPSASSISTSTSAGPGSGHDCVPPGGGRCAGPASLANSLTGPLTLSSDGHTISGDFECGGTLTATESSQEVTLTFNADAVRAGALSCAQFPLTVYLSTPLGDRALVDGTTHQPLALD